MRTKYYVYDHSTKQLLGQHLTRKDAIYLVKHSKNIKHTKMYVESFERY